jgi:Tat protein secretion system quality control protein TatD with DNase activity
MADRHNRDIDRPVAPLPDPLPIPAVDSHAHLEIITNSSPDDPAIKKVIDESASVGINRIVQVGYSAEQSEWSLSLAKIYKGQVLATVALHPNEAPVVTDLEADLSGDVEMAKECVSKGYYLSFAGTLTFKNAPHLRDALLQVPRELLLAETDSPFLTPDPFRGYLNTPAQTARTIRFMAELRGDDLEELIHDLNRNAERCFGSFN